MKKNYKVIVSRDQSKKGYAFCKDHLKIIKNAATPEEIAVAYNETFDAGMVLDVTVLKFEQELLSSQWAAVLEVIDGMTDMIIEDSLGRLWKVHCWVRYTRRGACWEIIDKPLLHAHARYQVVE